MKKAFDFDKKPIMLVGFMGTGKSTVGKLLASLLSFRHIDTDGEIEKEYGMSVAEIFSTKGEKKFRETETEILLKCSGEGLTVVSCGGGIILSEKNRSVLKNESFVVWLKCPVEICLDRCAGSRRPLINKENSLINANELYGKRKQLYHEVADMEINTDCFSPSEIAERIAREVKSAKLNQSCNTNDVILTFENN